MFEKLKKRLKTLQTHCGFPLAIGEEPHQTTRRRGVALLIAIMTIMLMVSMATDLIIASTVSIQLAASSRDRIRAEYLSKSGFNLSLFLLSVSWAYDLFLTQPSSPMKQPLNDSAKSIWNLINKLPPIGSKALELAKLAKDDADDPFKLRSLFSEKVGTLMSLFEDSFSMNVQDEASKINVNECYQGRCTEAIQKLTALFSCPAEKAFLESKNIDPNQLAYRIKDFISNSDATSSESGFGDKNGPYSSQTPPYGVKKLPFDSVDELKLIAGWDDEIHAVFAPYLTVFPYPVPEVMEMKAPININTVSPELLGCLIPEARSQACSDTYMVKMHKIIEDKGVVAEKNEDIKSKLNSLTCYTGPTGQDDQDRKPETWFAVNSSVFRIEVIGQIGNLERKLTAVVRRILPQEKTGGRSQQRVKRSYQILYWNLI